MPRLRDTPGIPPQDIKQLLWKGTAQPAVWQVKLPVHIAATRQRRMKTARQVGASVQSNTSSRTGRSGWLEEQQHNGQKQANDGMTALLARGLPKK